MLKQSSYTTFLSNYIFTPQPTIQIDTFGRSIVTPHTYIHLVLKQRPSLRTPIHTPCTIKFRPITHLLRIYYRGAALLSLSLSSVFFPRNFSRIPTGLGVHRHVRDARAHSTCRRRRLVREERGNYDDKSPSLLFSGAFLSSRCLAPISFFSSLPEVLGACVYAPRRVIWRDEKCSSAQ